MIADSYRLNIPFGVYGEAIFIIGQNLILISQIWKYNNIHTSLEKTMVLVALFYASYIVFISGVGEHLHEYMN